MSYGEVMALPMRVFWHLSNSIERLHKDEAKLQFEMLASAQTPEAGVQMREHLAQQAPDPISVNRQAAAMNEVLDSVGLNALRMMA